MDNTLIPQPAIWVTAQCRDMTLLPGCCCTGYIKAEPSDRSHQKGKITRTPKHAYISGRNLVLTDIVEAGSTPALPSKIGKSKDNLQTFNINLL